MRVETFTSRRLTLTVREEPDGIVVLWTGRSTAFNPAEFLVPILTVALDRACELRRPLTLDFRSIEYFNSSTMAPVARLLEEAGRRNAKLTLLYDGKQRWQELSFSALRALHTAERIQVMP